MAFFTPNNRNIEIRVMEKLRCKIAQKQEEYDNKVIQLRMERDNIIAGAHANCEDQERVQADKIVQSIFTSEFLKD